MLPEIKVCGKCGIEKKYTEFPLRKKKNKNTGAEYIWLRMECYECCRKIAKDRYIKDPSKKKELALRTHHADKKKSRDRANAWRNKNKEKIKLTRKIKYLEDSDARKAKRKEYYYANKEKVIASVSTYVVNNKEKVRLRQNNRHHQKKNTDLTYILTRRLRGRIRHAVKDRAVKADKSAKLIGCSIKCLVSHLESQFYDGMTWENISEWHIDHKKPCALFDMTDEHQQRECFHWSNLQPLWAADNLKKWKTY